MRNPSALLGEPTDWQPEEYGVAVLRSADVPEHEHELGVTLAREMLVQHALRHHIAIDTIEEHRTTGKTLVYFAGVRVLHARQRAALQAELDADRGHAAFRELLTRRT